MDSLQQDFYSHCYANAHLEFENKVPKKQILFLKHLTDWAIAEDWKTGGNPVQCTAGGWEFL